MNIEKLEGLVFRTPDGDEFGPMRAFFGNLPEDLLAQNVTGFAEDSCGNYFVSRAGVVFFWDHDTDQLERLAETHEAFLHGVVAPTPVDLKSSQVIRVWIDPDFERQLREHD